MQILYLLPLALTDAVLFGRSLLNVSSHARVEACDLAADACQCHFAHTLFLQFCRWTLRHGQRSQQPVSMATEGDREHPVFAS